MLRQTYGGPQTSHHKLDHTTNSRQNAEEGLAALKTVETFHHRNQKVLVRGINELVTATSWNDAAGGLGNEKASDGLFWAMLGKIGGMVGCSELSWD